MADNHNAININIDTSGIDRATEHLQHVKGGAQIAIKKAMNVTVTGIRTDAGRLTPKTFAVDAETVKKRMWVTRATDSSLSAEVGRSGPRFFARNFPRDPNTMPGRRGGKAVFLRPRRDGGGWFLDSERNLSKAFVVTNASGNRKDGSPRRKMNRGSGIYRRIEGHRSRLVHARGLSVPEMLGDVEVRRAIEANATRRLNTELDRQVALMLKNGEGVKT